MRSLDTKLLSGPSRSPGPSRHLPDLPATDVPRPEYWSGFRLTPEAIEFWQGRENRLHERTLYRLESGRWTASVLAP